MTRTSFARDAAGGIKTHGMIWSTDTRGLSMLCRRRAGLSEEQAADVFQEVFVTLLEKIDEIREPEKIRAWMVTTAKFKTWGVVRGTKDHYNPATEEEMDAEMAAITDTSPLADEMLIELEEQHMIRSALKLIEERCQKILSMIYLCDPAASYAEVATAIGVGETSISPLARGA